jgi:hypothetical protein
MRNKDAPPLALLWRGIVESRYLIDTDRRLANSDFAAAFRSGIQLYGKIKK